MSLLDIIEEQIAFGFTGKVNVLFQKNGQFAATVFLEEGALVGCLYRAVNSKRSFVNLVFDDVRGAHDYKYIVEPEIISKEKQTFRENVGDLKKEIQDLFKEYEKVEKYAPSENLKLVIDNRFIESDENLSREEFDLLSIITEYSRVGDIYNHSDLYDYEVTLGLIALRKKKAIRVFN